jgi:DNA-binding NtrC family response regulator
MIDDDPQHLALYTVILQRGGFDPISALVTSSGVDLPEERDVDVVVLDYRLGVATTAVEVASCVQTRYPDVPILVLSDLFGMPSDIAPYAIDFIRKGEPKHLLDTLSRLTTATP